MHQLAGLMLTIFLVALPQMAAAQLDDKWVVSWVASAHGPYPVGNPSAQEPDQKFAFPSRQQGQTIRPSDLLCGQVCGDDRCDCA